MKLSPRLYEISKLVEKGLKVADIGTDHGYVPVELLKNGISPYAIASDVNEGPLNSARSYVGENKLEENIDLRLGSGLETVKIGEVDVAIIAGMGGILISEIIEARKEVAYNLKYMILQPMVGHKDLREYLYSNGFEISDERLVKEDQRIYEIIVAKKGSSKLEDDMYYEIAKTPIERKDDLAIEYLNKKMEKYQKIIESIEKNGNADSNKKYEEVKAKLLWIKNVRDKI